MMEDQNNFIQKAREYDLLANYYKYTDPAKHIHYYKKHLKYMYRGLEINRNHHKKKPTYVRFLHAGQQVKKIDIYINGRRLFRDVDFKNNTKYMTLPAGKYHIDIYPAGNQVSSIINKTVELDANHFSTLAVIGIKDKLRLIPFIDKQSPNASTSLVRFIHVSSDLPAVTVTINNTYTLFNNISYKNATNYLPLSPMMVNLEIKEVSTGKLIKTLPNISFKPNQAHSIVLIDSTVKII